MSEQETKDTVQDKKAPCRVTFEAGESVYQGTSMHFNDKGMLVMCRQPASLQAKGRILIDFPGLTKPVELVGEVVWTNMHGVGDSLSPKGMGIKFINVERDTERLLSELASQYDSLSNMYACYYS